MVNQQNGPRAALQLHALGCRMNKPVLNVTEVLVVVLSSFAFCCINLKQSNVLFLAQRDVRVLVQCDLCYCCINTATYCRLCSHQALKKMTPSCNKEQVSTSYPGPKKLMFLYCIIIHASITLALVKLQNHYGATLKVKK